MKLLATLAVVIGIVCGTATSLSLERGDELMELKNALRSLEEKEAANSEAAQQLPAGNVCPSCLEGSVCCRYGSEFSCCVKIYSDDVQQYEIHKEQNYVKYFLQNGEVHVTDFSKDMLSYYNPEEKECYIAPEIGYTMENVIAGTEGKDNPNSKLTTIENNYAVKDDKPVEDHSLLHDSLQEICTGKPLYWATSISGEEAKETRELSIERRGKKGRKVAKVAAKVGVGMLIG